MADAPVSTEGGRVPLRGLVLVCLAVWGLVLGALVGRADWAGTMLALLQDGPVAVAIFLSAGGWGWLALRRLMPRGTPPGLAAVTCIAGGLWLLGTAMLTLGTLMAGALTAWLWWPVVGVGLALAVWAVRDRLTEVRLPETVEGTSVLWVAGAVAGGFWLAGAVIPPGLVGVATGDFYDVVSYHLQVPREYLQAGRIHELPHNTYSYYPFGGQMLFLLGMILRGGVYEGVFAAKLTHGLWGVLAVLAIYHGLAGESPWRRRMAGVLLATVPWVIYLSWLAFVELSQLAYLAVGLAWLWRWTREPSWRAALLVGLGAGGALATKNLSLGLVTAPLLALMLPTVVRRPERLGHVLLAGGTSLALMGPWLVRNLVYTGNPVFPLATRLLGRGHWSAASTSMWDAAHAPVPWADKPAAVARALVPESFNLADASLGLLLLIVVAAAAVWVLVRGRRSSGLDWLCLGILGIQVAVWAMATHMPGRFLVPAAVPMAVLAAGFTDWLSRLERGSRPGQANLHNSVPAGFAVAVLTLLATVGMNLMVARDLYRITNTATPRLHGWRVDKITHDLHRAIGLDQALPPGSRPLMVGDVRPFLFPQPVIYQSVWEPGPLATLAEQETDPTRILSRLRDEYGATHILVHWGEIRRLRRTYGWWTQVDEAMFESLQAAGARRTWSNEDGSTRIYALEPEP